MNEGDLVQFPNGWWVRLGPEQKPHLRPATELDSDSGFFLVPGWEKDVVARVRVNLSFTPRPCLDPDKMHGAADQFGGSDYEDAMPLDLD